MKQAPITYEDGHTAKDGKHYWLTPPELYEELDAEFNFDFDACPYPRPEGYDSIKVEWGKSTYVNPPFRGPTKWVRKAIEEYKKGKRVVFVFPIDKWVHFFIEAGAEIRNLGDVKWHSIEDNEPGKGTGRWIACFVLDPNRQDATSDLLAACELIVQAEQAATDEDNFELLVEATDAARAAIAKAKGA